MFKTTQVAFADYWNQEIVFTVDALEENGLAIYQQASYYLGTIKLTDYAVMHIESGLIHKANLKINKAKKYVRLFNAGLTDRTTIEFANGVWLVSPEYLELHKETLRRIENPQSVGQTSS